MNVLDLWQLLHSTRQPLKQGMMCVHYFSVMVLIPLSWTAIRRLLLILHQLKSWGRRSTVSLAHVILTSYISLCFILSLSQSPQHPLTFDTAMVLICSFSLILLIFLFLLTHSAHTTHAHVHTTRTRTRTHVHTTHAHTTHTHTHTHKGAYHGSQLDQYFHNIQMAMIGSTMKRSHSPGEWVCEVRVIWLVSCSLFVLCIKVCSFSDQHFYNGPSFDIRGCCSIVLWE